jgi:2-polyprenyl-6-methoxyphenol hydroxylase-like FAD-dependent oxidoreductase
MDGATTILGPHGYGMFMALHELKSAASQPTPHETSGFLLDNTSDYIFWAFVAWQEKFPFKGSSQPMDGEMLRAAAMTMTEGWHPNLRHLVREADPSTLIYKSLRTSMPVRPWKTSHVTLVGDAIHSMPPTRGIGGSTALRDASVLTQKLVAAEKGQQSLINALHEYEGEMLKYGFAAVRSSLQAMNMIVAEQRLFYRVMLRIAGLFAA